MAVLVLTTVLPWAQRSGGEIVSLSIVAAIAEAGHEIRVVGYRRPGHDEVSRDGEVCAGSRPIETASAGLRVVPWMGRALATRTAYSVSKYASRGYARALRTASQGRVDAVIADHAQVSFALPHVPDDVPLVFVAHNAEARLYAETAAGAGRRAARWVHGREARAIATAEAELAQRAAQVWTLTDDDREYFASHHPAADIRSLDVPARDSATARSPSPRYDVGLIGNWSWAPNRTGLEWFSDRVVPLLPETCSIHVAGAGSEWLDGRHPNVSVRGRVAEAGDFMSHARVLAVPARAGSGVQVKTLDAIATGVPVVATSTGVRGLGPLPSSVAVADDPSAFATAIDEALRSGGGEHARVAAREWSAARRERFASTVDAWLAEAIGGVRQPAGKR